MYHLSKLDSIKIFFSGLSLIIFCFIPACQSDDTVKKEGLSLEHRFFKGIDTGNMTLVEECLAQGLPVDRKDALGNSGLIYAVDHENQKLVRLLIEHGANVNLRNTVGETALYRAVFRGNLDMVKLLIELKAESKIRNIEGISPVVLAEERGEDAIQLYLENLKK